MNCRRSVGMVVTCKRCGVAVKSFSVMRKWCVDCRRLVMLEQAKLRKQPVLAVSLPQDSSSSSSQLLISDQEIG